MGIPSYYKELIQRHKELVGTGIPAGLLHPTHLHFDLNCAIYHCVHMLQTKQPFEDSAPAEWESSLCDEVCAYITMLVNHVNPGRAINICIDGVAPAAKMRQQRQRRFKSVYMRQVTDEIAARLGLKPQKHWDTNAITPGTQFMEHLSARIFECCADGMWAGGALGRLVSFSDSNTPGEGEHKIHQEILGGGTGTEAVHVIYGLDADLILLAALEVAEGHKVLLLREKVEFGQIQIGTGGQEKLLYFDIPQLADIICQELEVAGGDADGEDTIPRSPSRTLRDYVFLCSILGNDFVPHGFSLNVHDDGLPRIQYLYSTVASAQPGRYLVEPIGSVVGMNRWQYNPGFLAAIFAEAAVNEQDWLQEWRRERKKLERAGSRPRPNADPIQRELNILEELPVTKGTMDAELSWQIPGAPSTDVELEDVRLRSEATYYSQFIGCTDQMHVVREYLKSLVWVLRYYCGGAPAVDLDTYYAWNLPPLWSTTAAVVTHPEFPGLLRGLDAECSAGVGAPVTPAEQCAMVFPAASMHLAPAAVRGVVKKLPTYFPAPAEIRFDVTGARYFWQCPAIIPIITRAILRR